MTETASGAEGGSGLSTAAGIRSVMEGVGLNVEGLAAQVYIGCIEENRDTAKFVKDTYALLDHHGIVLGCDVKPEGRVAAVTSADCVAFLLSPESIESMYDSEKGLGAEIKATIETRSKYILLATPSFRWAQVEAKKLDWGVKDIFLETFLPVDLSGGFVDSLDSHMVTPSNASSTMSWWKTIILTIITASVCAAFVLAFSGMGFGVPVFHALSEFYGWPVAIAGGVSLGLLLTLYLFDFSYWTGNWKIVRNIGLGITILAAATGIVLAAERYPAAPQAMFMIGVPAVLFVTKRILFRRDEISAYLGSLAISLGFSTVAMLGVWIWYLTWPGIGMWGADLRANYQVAMKCGNVKFCLAAFLLWLSPLVAAVASLVFSLMVFFLSRSVQAKGGSRMQAAMKLFVMLLAMSLLGVWIAASIAGAAMSMSNVVMMFSAAAAVVLGITIVSQVGWRSLKEKIQTMPALQKLAQSSLMEWLKAAVTLVAIITPLFLIYLFLSFFNQILRKRISCVKNIYENNPEAKDYKLTLVAHNQFEAMKGWNWTSVLVKTVWIGVFFVLINVGVGKVTTLFLSWLNDALSSLDTYLIFIIFYLVGLFMFLLPPVPGVPVYITGGIILVSAVAGPTGENYWIGCVAACVTCFCIKLTAIAMQQKLIGQMSSGSVAVRSFVGINSLSIRAIRKVLSAPGLSMGKVSILIGGPDWPTSVLTGIMRLSLIQMLIGSLPVLFLVVPTTLAGAFQLMRSVSPTWESVASVTLSVAALVQSGALLAAMYYIEKTISHNRDELDAEVLDDDVAARERKQAVLSAAYASATHWKIVPLFMKIVLILAALLQAVASYVIFFNGDGCFESFEVTDSISNAPLNGNALNMFKPLGVVVSFIWLASVFLLIVFKQWAGCKARSAASDGNERLSDLVEVRTSGETNSSAIH